MAAGFGLKEFEVVEGAVPGALGGIDAALEEGEILAAANEIESDAVGVVTDVFDVALVVPDFGVGEGVAAEEPFGIDEGSYRKDSSGVAGCQRSKYWLARARRAGGLRRR